MLGRLIITCDLTLLSDKLNCRIFVSIPSKSMLGPFFARGPPLDFSSFPYSADLSLLKFCLHLKALHWSLMSRLVLVQTECVGMSPIKGYSGRWPSDGSWISIHICSRMCVLDLGEAVLRPLALARMRSFALACCPHLCIYVHQDVRSPTFREKEHCTFELLKVFGDPHPSATVASLSVPETLFCILLIRDRQKTYLSATNI